MASAMVDPHAAVACYNPRHGDPVAEVRVVCGAAADGEVLPVGAGAAYGENAMTSPQQREADRIFGRKLLAVFIVVVGSLSCVTSGVVTTGWVLTAGLAGIQPVTPTPAEQEARAREATRHRLMLGGFVVGSVAVMGVGIWVWPRRPREDRDAGHRDAD